jgi:hypothetical protein
MVTHKELLLRFERELRQHSNENGDINLRDIERETNRFLGMITAEEQVTTPIQKFIFVEDGSVDVDELIEGLEMSNPEIKVVVYRQGANPPELVEVK